MCLLRQISRVARGPPRTSPAGALTPPPGARIYALTAPSKLQSALAACRSPSAPGVVIFVKYRHREGVLSRRLHFCEDAAGVSERT
jgi:hypothetical protein